MSAELELTTEVSGQSKQDKGANMNFDTFWSVYPKRLGSNPRKPAEEKFARLVKSGVAPATLVRAAMQFAEQEKKAIGSPFIPMASTWLNQQRFADMSIDEPLAGPPRIDWDAICVSYVKFRHWSRYAGPDPESPACRCPREILVKHGVFGLS